MIKNTLHKSDLKIALLYIKLRNYSQAKVYLDKAFHKAKADKDKNTVLWFKVFRDLKSNDLANLVEEILSIEERKKIFFINKKLPLELYFNKEKYLAKEYFDKITKFTSDRKYQFMYYFAPFIFEDYDAMHRDVSKSFIIKNQNSIGELNTMVQYNADFLKVIKLDPIQRTQVLKEMLDLKYDTNSYEYYNLGLCYAQIYDYNNAYKYFKKAYSLDHGNKMYSVMTFLTAKKLGLKIDKIQKNFIVKDIMSKKGSYRYLAKYLYKLFEDSSIKLNPDLLTHKQKKSIFFRALYFLENIDKNGILETEPLLVEFDKDPLVHMLNLVARQKDENDYLYISRIQDKVPKIYNSIFLKGPLVITDFYLDTLRALGLFNRVDFNIDKELSPSYLRLKSIVHLYRDKPKTTIKLIEYIQKKYDLQSVDSYYILIAAYLSSGEKELAYTTLSEIELLYNDKDARFLSGVKLIQDLKLNTVSQYFQYKLDGKLVDFKLKGFDDYLESL